MRSISARFSSLVNGRLTTAGRLSARPSCGTASSIHQSPYQPISQSLASMISAIHSYLQRISAQPLIQYSWHFAASLLTDRIPSVLCERLRRLPLWASRRWLAALLRRLLSALRALLSLLLLLLLLTHPVLDQRHFSIGLLQHLHRTLACRGRQTSKRRQSVPSAVELQALQPVPLARTFVRHRAMTMRYLQEPPIHFADFRIGMVRVCQIRFCGVLAATVGDLSRMALR
jgi:hypothetical protein